MVTIKRSRKRSRKLSKVKVAPELPEKKRKRWSTRGGKELGCERQEKVHTSKPRKLLVSYDHAHLNLKLKSQGVRVEGENAQQRCQWRDGRCGWRAFPRRNIDVHFKNPKYYLPYVETRIIELSRHSLFLPPSPSPSLSSSLPFSPSLPRCLPPSLQFSYLASNKTRTWKNTKQILTADRDLPWKIDDPTCKQQYTRTPHLLCINHPFTTVSSFEKKCCKVCE